MYCPHTKSLPFDVQQMKPPGRGAAPSKYSWYIGGGRKSSLVKAVFSWRRNEPEVMFVPVNTSVYWKRCDCQFGCGFVPVVNGLMPSLVVAAPPGYEAGCNPFACSLMRNGNEYMRSPVAASIRVGSPGSQYCSSKKSMRSEYVSICFSNQTSLSWRERSPSAPAPSLSARSVSSQVMSEMNIRQDATA